VTLWEVDIFPAAGRSDTLAQALALEAAELGLGQDLAFATARGFLLQGALSEAEVTRIARELLADLVVETPVIHRVGEAALNQPRNGLAKLLHVLPKPGVTDAVAASTQKAIADFGLQADAVITLRKYWLKELDATRLKSLTYKLLANDSIEQVVHGPLTMKEIHLGAPYKFQLEIVPIRDLNGEQLLALSKARTLSCTLVEMETIQAHFRELGRDPTDAELESIAQTWSEHCSHKTLAGRIHYCDEQGERHFENMLKETIFAATQTIRQRLGEQDWCVSVFQDNAGVVRFNDEYNLAFKVETHNRPSALEPYGGANTGIGGVIRDTLGTGMGAKPICNTDIFCFAPPDMPVEQLPPGVLHPRRIMRGVVAGVRDYGNRMGIPTVNGAILFDERYVGNPLVFCGDVGILPRDKSFKHAQPNDLIVALGGRTGRDGIHGATFSSVELTSESEHVSGGAVQIGNAITEKMLLDVLLVARDRGLFNCVTDCGAGGFSSAVGEMGEEIGAEVWLDQAPLKYAGLSYTEIWISEAQERMILAVPEAKWSEFEALCRSESVEATVIGRFTPTQQLRLTYQGEEVANVAMSFLHKGRPKVVREARYTPQPTQPLSLPIRENYNTVLLQLLGSLNIASKEWVIRQYDHEVQGGSVIKPLVGIANDGPSDAAVVRPLLNSRAGVVLACGMNPRYGDLDPYAMAAGAIDEAIRNCVAVGANPERIAILDNFCWGYTDRPETLGSLVRAALACQETALAYQTPFISGKDSLNNEYSYDDNGTRRTISIPSSLLISAMGQVKDVAKCVTMDFKQAGNLIYILGSTKRELGGSHVAMVAGLTGGQVPLVNTAAAKTLFSAVHQAMQSGLIRSCHDLSEGGLAVSVAEMAFAGGLGAEVHLSSVPFIGSPEADQTAVLLFAESHSRFLCEVAPAQQAAFEAALQGLPHALIGSVNTSGRLRVIAADQNTVLDLPLEVMKATWQKPLSW
jgi:phosphoribosylformylglycinamidine synthase